MKCPAASLFGTLSVTVEAASAETVSLIEVDISAYKGQYVTAEDKVGIATARQQGCMGNQNTLAHRDLWWWLVDHSVPGNGMNCSLQEYYLIYVT